jgi:short-subunit dehydrogenase
VHKINNTGLILTGSTGGIGRHIARLCSESNLKRCIFLYRSESKYNRLFSGMHGESVSSFLLDMGKSDTDFSKIGRSTLL